MRGLRLPIVVVTLIVCLFASSEKSQAYISLLDGDLEINGFFKEQMFIRTAMPREEGDIHKSDIDFWRTNFIIEGLYKLKQDGDLTINLFGGFKYYYEKSPAIDSEKKRSINRWNYDKYLRPYDDDLLSELYVDFQYGPLQLKVGKQIVVWGETNLKQTADIINPLDLRYGSPGTEAWEDIKLGLYMIRGLYQTDLPGQLNFEFIFIPGDFEAVRLPNENTYQGGKTYQSTVDPLNGGLPDFGIAEWAMEKARRDEPGWNISNWEAGIKLRGYTWNVDWSVFYFNTINDAPTISDSDINAFKDFGAIYVLDAFDSDGDGVFNPQYPDYKVFSFKRYEVIGATFQTRFENFPVSEWRLESFYLIGEPLNATNSGTQFGTYKGVRKDTFGFGLEGRDYYRIPYITHNWFDDKKMAVSVSIFYEKILGFSRELILRKGRGHRTGDSHASEITWSFSQQFFRAKWFAMFTGSYNFIGKWFVLPVLSYAPGEHWRFEAGLPLYGSSASSNRGLNEKDSVLLRVRYEF